MGRGVVRSCRRWSYTEEMIQEPCSLWTTADCKMGRASRMELAGLRAAPQQVVSA